MEIEEKHKILRNWMIKNYNQPKNWDNGGWLYYSHLSNYLMLIKPLFKKWQELLKKGYSEKQLIDYFLEVVRKELPELKGIKLYFSLYVDDDKIYKTI